ncbi:MAG: DNA polymerase III subunit delta [Candidatus Dormibacteraeota bacterium]|nr:DNA polymerase III subunit delta [Candidatus Dormibacteraeota bacterium]MBO0762724.1 DNA polymerase III subunit delta [Candidatus Dormibacteraeota bacterium]
MPPPKDAWPLLLHGDEGFLVDDEARRTLRRWRQDLVSDFGYDQLDPATLTASRLRDAVLQAPFLDPHRVVSVRGIPPRRADALATGLREVPESTRLLLTVTGRLGQGSALVKAVTAANGRVTEHAPLRPRAMQDWVVKRAREYDLPPNAGALVARMARADLGVMDAELRKLAAYQAGGNQLDQAAITELVAGDRQEEIFRLTDNLLPRPTGQAWRVTANLLEREQPTTIAYRLARHLSLVLEVRARQDRGESLSTVQGAMREHPFVVQKAYEAAREVTAERLEAGLRALLTYEWEVKSGQIDAEWGLQVALAKL